MWFFKKNNNKDRGMQLKWSQGNHIWLSALLSNDFALITRLPHRKLLKQQLHELLKTSDHLMAIVRRPSPKYNFQAHQFVQTSPPSSGCCRGGKNKQDCTFDWKLFCRSISFANSSAGAVTVRCLHTPAPSHFWWSSGSKRCPGCCGFCQNQPQEGAGTWPGHGHVG